VVGGKERDPVSEAFELVVCFLHRLVQRVGERMVREDVKGLNP